MYKLHLDREYSQDILIDASKEVRDWIVNAIANKIIPIPKPISLAGHTSPLYAAAIFSVPLIDQYEIIKPGMAINKALSLDHSLKN